MELRLKRYYRRKRANMENTLECKGEDCTQPKQAFLFEGELCSVCFRNTSLLHEIRHRAKRRGTRR